MVRQIKHVRRSKKGKQFPAGSRAVIKEHHADIRQTLKRKGRVSLPKIGTFRVKTKKARKARMGTNPFTGERMRFKAKPRSRVVKFRAAKDLLAVL